VGNYLKRSRHGTVFYFRRRVPSDVVAGLRRTHLVVSLRVADRDTAVRRARALAAASDRLFEELRPVSKRRKDDPAKWSYGMGIEFDPKSGRLVANFTDVKPDDQPAIDRHLATIASLNRDSATDTPSAPGNTPTIEEAATQVLADPGLKPTTRKEYKRVFDRFAEFFGADTRLGDVPQDRFATYADSIAAIPGWSEKTKANHIANAARLYGFFSARNTAVPTITTRGLKPKRTRPAGEDRHGFTVDELGILFRNAARYRERRPHKWWVTVAPAFLGCRIEELAQAHLGHDIARDPASGTWFLRIDEKLGDRSSPKSVKSLGGWRTVPIHSALVDAGLIDYLDAELTQGAVTPFGRHWSPFDDKTIGGVKHSHSIVKWGARELAKLQAARHIDPDRRLSYFHSMRHGFTTMLATAGVNEEWRAALTGHAYGGMNAQVYNKARDDLRNTGPILERGLAPLAQVLRDTIAR